MKDKNFESLKVVKEIKKELTTMYCADCYYLLSVYYAFLSEFHYCFKNCYNKFNAEILREFYSASDEKYKDDIEKVFADKNIVVYNN